MREDDEERSHGGKGRLRFRLRRARYRLLLQEEVAATIEPGGDIMEEIRDLRSLFT